MSGRSFIDTNIFVYTVDAGAPMAKKRLATDLIREVLGDRRGIVSYQVVQEFLAVATKKFAIALPPADARHYLDTVLVPMLAVHSSVELFDEALHVQSRYQTSWYDALIVAAASEASCSVIYTEDLQHGAKINGIRIENPFRSRAAH